MSWETKKLGEVVNLTQGFCINKKSNHMVVEKGIPLLRITDMINSQEKIYISDDIPKKFIANADDIIFTRTGQVGLVFRNQYGVIHNNCFTVSPINNDLSKDYLYWFLRSDDTQLKAKGLAAGAAQPDLNHGAFKSIFISYPKSLQTQKRIADILSAYDDLIENNLKRIKLLEQAAQNIYKEWFVHMRFPDYENTSINEDTGLPEGWGIENLGDFVEINKGKNITKDTVKEGSVPVVAGGLNPAYFHNTSNTTNPVITVSASGANAGYINVYLEDIWASDCSYIDSSMSQSIFFIYSTLISQQDLIFGLQRGAAQPHVYPKDLKRVEVLIPEEGIILKFEKLVTPLFNMKRALLNQNQKLKPARDILLPRLMNRTIEV